MLQSGRTMQLAYLLAAFVVLMILLWLQRRKAFTPRVRKIAALDAIGELVGRATEMGRPIHVSPGTPSYGESIEVETVVGLTVTSYVSRLCAKYGVRCIATASLPELLPVMQEVVRQAYVAEGKPDAYREEDVRFLSDNMNAYAAGVIGIVERENCAGNIVIGKLYGQSFMLFARGSVAGDVMNIGGTAYYLNVPHLVASCDYVLLGEELFAAEAYLTQDPKHLTAVFSQDIFKVVSLAVLIIGVLLRLAGSSAMANLLNI